MIALSANTVDADGNVVFDETNDSNLRDTARRVSRTKTLDGGCVIVDGGWTASDKTLNIGLKYDAAKVAVVKHLHEDYTLILISMNEGFYSGVISGLSFPRTGVAEVLVEVLIKEQIA